MSDSSIVKVEASRGAQDIISNISALLGLVHDKVRANYEAKRAANGGGAGVFAPSVIDENTNHPDRESARLISENVTRLADRVEKRGNGFAPVETEALLGYEQEAQKLQARVCGSPTPEIKSAGIVRQLFEGLLSRIAPVR